MQETAPPTVGNTSVSVGNPWLFFVVTFAITWGFWLVAIALGLRFDSAAGLLLLLLGLIVPGAAGVGFVYLVYDESGRTDFWDRVKQVRRISLRWFFVILFLSPVVVIIAALADIVLGGTSVSLGEWVYEVGTNPIVFLPTLFFATLPPLLEELGWRGYALDRLQLDHSALVSGLILGVIWSIWHLPLFFIAGSYQHDMVGFGTLEFWMFMIGIVPLSVAFTWVYNNTARSILAIILLHGWTNFTVQTIDLTGRSEVFHIGLWFAVIALITVLWGAKTLTKDDKMPPHPPRNRREIAPE
ncbi:Membrane protease YdiL, CAAX protease family [Halogranum amylolyticum]|uniref:Membrane protease YdiL, CAAX protease family n=1 Tax=Halogranum amylolyticum TaxID=660520 RepID=A0A1H8ULB8_9EURY|nr:type II CAAX endopeptidase family protein [Halogranum amylolyticum]SEP03807.1 Membrane protease YdiL, CAAX protease family [Halogranum amylolyticum]